MTDRRAVILARLERSPATLAGLRAALPDGDAHRTALPSMGEPDPFGAELTALVQEGVVTDVDGRYALAPVAERATRPAGSPPRP